MNKVQILAIGVAVLLFAGLYFGASTKPDKQKKIESSRAINRASTDFETLIAEARLQLTTEQASKIAVLDQQLATDNLPDTAKVGLLKKLSGSWYRIGNLVVAGEYAEQVANIVNTDAAWSVAGATYFNGLLAAKEEKIRSYSAARAVKAFESAISLAPDQVEHQVNLALVYAEAPPQDNPMRAVLMLRDMETKYPNAPAVFNALGRLAIKTSQWDRAVQRLEKAWSLDKKNPNTPCLLAQAYEGAGNNNKANEFKALCNGG